MTFKNKKSFELINNLNVNTKLKNPIPIHSKPTVLKENFSSLLTPFINIMSKPVTTFKDTTIDLTEVCILFLFV
jgi:hypothetical protein